MSYDSGVLTEEFLNCSARRKNINHAVVIVGYGKVTEQDALYGNKDTECKEYWIVRNSWGADWGENGFFRLCMDESERAPNGTCQINSYVQYPIAEAPEQFI